MYCVVCVSDVVDLASGDGRGVIAWCFDCVCS